MKRKALLFFATMLMSIGMAHADEPFTGVLVTTPDGETTYALTEMPKISYTTDAETNVVTAQLFTTDRTTPVATVELKDGNTLKAQWGTYTAGVTSEKLTTYQKNGKKYFTGGKLIIIGKDGKQYDASGKVIN